MSDPTAIAAMQVRIRDLEATVQAQSTELDRLLRALAMTKEPSPTPVRAVRPVAGKGPKGPT